MSELRSLLASKLAATMGPKKLPNAAELLDFPTALESVKSYSLPLVCKRTGLTVGAINVAAVAGHLPVIGQWKETMVLHPIFSLAPIPLLKFARNTWFRFCNFSPLEVEDEKLTKKQEQMLQICAVAMLHHLTEIRQDISWLPEWQDVSDHWTSLIALSYWKAYLDSQRFRFPSIHISRMEPTVDLKEYLNLCWTVKKNYETTVNEKIEVAKLKAAEEAMIALRDEVAGARPSSNRQLWRWFAAHLPARYKKDLETWMPEIFFAKGEEIRNFTIRDIDLLEEIFLSECPTGSAISHAFSEILAAKRKYLQDHFEAFEIIIPQEIVAAKAAGEIPVDEPQLKDFPSKAMWMIARAKWKLAHTDLTTKIDAAMGKQKELSVAASYIPELKIGFDEPVEEETGEEDEVDSYRRRANDEDHDGTGD